MHDDETYDIIESINSFPYIETCQGISHVCVKKNVYDAFLSEGFTQTDAHKQLNIDAPRCNMYVDGELSVDTRLVVSNLVPYCTQAVVALPLFLLSGNAIVVEQSPTKRMIVDVWIDRFIYVKKYMDVCYKTHTTPVCINIFYDDLSDDVMLKLQFFTHQNTRFQ